MVPNPGPEVTCFAYFSVFLAIPHSLPLSKCCELVKLGVLEQGKHAGYGVLLLDYSWEPVFQRVNQRSGSKYTNKPEMIRQ